MTNYAAADDFLSLTHISMPPNLDKSQIDEEFQLHAFTI